MSEMFGDGVPYRLRLSGNLAIQTIDDTLLQLRQALTENAAVDVDCTAVAEVDVSAIQLFLAARLSAGNAGKTLRILIGDGGMAAALEAGGFFTPGNDGAKNETFWIAERR
jgi:ABC-type transporter Mla MlaB component